MRAKLWQRDAIARLRSALADGSDGLRHRAALLQLPTGLGKSLVALRTYKSVAKRYPGLPLLLVVPAQTPELPRGWRAALEREILPGGEEAGWDVKDCRATLRGSQLGVTTHRKLLKPRAPWKAWLKSRFVFIIVDEAHKLGSLKHIGAAAFWSGNRDVPHWMARPGIGRPPRGPFVMLVSATPYNPVSLDGLEDVAEQESAQDRDTLENKKLEGEVREVQGLLGQLDRAFEDVDRVKAYCESVRKALEGGEGPICSNPLSVVPRFTHHLKPRAPGEHDLRLPRPDVERAVDQLIAFHRRWHEAGVQANRTIVERLYLGGSHCRPRARTVLGQTHGLSTRRALAIVSKAGAADVKLEAVTDLVKRIRDRVGKCVVFCTHIATARSVAATLRGALGDPCLVHDSTLDSDDVLELFLQKGIEKPSVVVATDRLSESIDLHWDPAARWLVHYELPWTPLRVLQRFGRLWRIPPSSKARGLPVAPHVFHVVHPGSVEEEIVHRLRRRWGHLEILGLGAVSAAVGLGHRIPRVPDDWEART